VQPGKLFVLLQQQHHAGCTSSCAAAGQLALVITAVSCPAIVWIAATAPCDVDGIDAMAKLVT
jgi:hypothetical protein